MDTISSILRENGISFLEDEQMKKHTSFKIGGKVKYFIIPKNVQEIIFVKKLFSAKGIKLRIIGNGTNMLITDSLMEGAFLYIGDALSEISIKDSCIIRAEAGALLVKVCRLAVENGLTGMEKLYGIPGSVGGALYMNAGAYGGEMKDVTVSAEYIDEDCELKEKDISSLELSYRHSFFSDTSRIITAVTFKLEKGEKEKILSDMEGYMSRRKDKQPLEYPSAGSVFKRPEGCFAGALIEENGLKGRAVGGACISTKHAGFIINTGNATAENVLSLISLCKETVYNNSGVLLEPEIRLID